MPCGRTRSGFRERRARAAFLALSYLSAIDMNLLTTAVAFIVTLGLLIVIHELGHYWVARLCNVKVLRFSLGFGRPLWARKFGADQTEWAVAAFPLGGYVKMLDEREGPVDAPELDRAFNRQSVGRRFAIVLAGPLANFLLAIVLYWALFMHGVPGLKPVLGPVYESTPAAAAGFRTGDTITGIDDEAVQTWQDARWILLRHAVRKSRVSIETRSISGERATREMDLTHLTPGGSGQRLPSRARTHAPAAGDLGRHRKRGGPWRRGTRGFAGRRRNRFDRREADRRVGARRVARALASGHAT